jgi:hypothetical protein
MLKRCTLLHRRMPLPPFHTSKHRCLSNNSPNTKVKEVELLKNSLRDLLKANKTEKGDRIEENEDDELHELLENCLRNSHKVKKVENVKMDLSDAEVISILAGATCGVGLGVLVVADAAISEPTVATAVLTVLIGTPMLAFCFGGVGSLFGWAWGVGINMLIPTKHRHFMIRILEKNA